MSITNYTNSLIISPEKDSSSNLTKRKFVSKEFVLLRVISELYLISLLAFLAGYNVIYQTTDSVEYDSYYNSITNEMIFGENGYEPLFNLLASVSKLVLKIDYNFFASILVFIALYIKFSLLSRRENSIILKLAYLCTLYLVFESLTLRAAVAISFGYLAFELRQQKILSWLFMMLGCLMHYSLLIFAPILLFYKILEKKEDLPKNIILHSIAFLIGIPLSIEVIINYNDRFANHVIANPDYFNIWGTPKIIIILLLLFYTYKRRANLDKTSCLLLYVFSIVTFIGASIFQFSMLSIRIVDIGIFSAYLIAGNRWFLNNFTGIFLFTLLILEQIFMRTLNAPELILQILKS